MTKPDKNFDTGLRILEVLNMLHEKDVSKSELILKMNKNSDFENIYSLEAFIKYFNTLSLFGFKIEKKGNKYKLNNAIGNIKLNTTETDLFVNLIESSKKLHNKVLEKKVRDIFYNSLKFFDDISKEKLLSAIKNSKQNLQPNNNSVNAIEGFMYDGQMVEITYLRKNNIQDKITVKIKEIVENNGDVIIVCHEKDKARNKKINLKSIIQVTQTPTMANKEDFYSDAVVFKVYDRLAELYRLKPGEKTIDFASGYKTILNTGEDKDVLLKRLLKYGENCEILKPQSLREDFMSLTYEILRNLEEE